MAKQLLESIRPMLTGGSPGFVMQPGLFFGVSGGLFQAGPLVVAPAATFTPSLVGQNFFQQTFAANTVEAIQLPIGVPAGIAAVFGITIFNTSGAGLTNITFVAAYKVPAAPTFPATGFNRTFLFLTDGVTAWNIGGSIADVAN